jgi:hypothetical protein
MAPNVPRDMIGIEKTRGRGTAGFGGFAYRHYQTVGVGMTIL